MKTAAVIPAYNEGSRIREALLAIRPHADLLVVVDDGSTDDTYEAARALQDVVALRHAVNRGQGAALKTGTDAALALGADAIVHIDADGQHNPAHIQRLIDSLKSGECDVAFGSRFLGERSTGMPTARRALLGLARQFNALALGIPRRVTDPQSGFRALTADAARKISFSQDRFAHCSEILRLVTRSDLPWKEVPVEIRYSADTLRKGQGPLDAFKIVWQLIIGAFH
jgi:glycosyltransferase involved in cell wall biosynthesis